MLCLLELQIYCVTSLCRNLQHFVSKTRRSDKLTHTYDALNRLTKVVSQDQGYTQNHEYNGRRLVMHDDNGAVTSYAYDNADRLISITAPSGKVIDMGYDANGRRTVTKFPNGLETRTGFDATPGIGGTGRLTSIAHGITSATGTGGTALDLALGTFSYDYTPRFQS